MLCGFRSGRRDWGRFVSCVVLGQGEGMGWFVSCVVLSQGEETGVGLCLVWF